MTAITGTGIQSVPAFSWSAEKYALKSWTTPVDALTTSASLTLGRLWVGKVVLAYDATISTISYRTVTAATTPTAGQCFAAIYNSAGALQAQTADISASLAASTTYSIAVVTPIALAAGDYYVGAFVNAAVSPTFASCPFNGLTNLGLTVPTARCMLANASLTTTVPSSLSNHTADSNILWFGIS